MESDQEGRSTMLSEHRSRVFHCWVWGRLQIWQHLTVYQQVFEVACEVSLYNGNVILSVPTLQGQVTSGEADSKGWVSLAVYWCQVYKKNRRLWDSYISQAQCVLMCTESSPSTWGYSYPRCQSSRPVAAQWRRDVLSGGLGFLAQPGWKTQHYKESLTEEPKCVLCLAPSRKWHAWCKSPLFSFRTCTKSALWMHKVLSQRPKVFEFNH